MADMHRGDAQERTSAGAFGWRRVMAAVRADGRRGCGAAVALVGRSQGCAVARAPARRLGCGAADGDVSRPGRVPVGVSVNGRHGSGAAEAPGRLSWGGTADVPAGRRRERAAFPAPARRLLGCPWPEVRAGRQRVCAVAEAREDRPQGCVAARPLVGRGPEWGTGPVPALRSKGRAVADEPSADASGGVAWTMP